MVSRWAHLKGRAVSMRRHGASVRDIENRLGIPRSNLSYWFRGVVLSKHHKQLLQKRHEKALIAARKEAVKWHNGQKAARMTDARRSALESLTRIDQSSNAIIELALSILYLGEGMKKSGMTSMGNSDPLILRFFVRTLNHLYAIPLEAMRCELHLRSDQDQKHLVRYWSKTLGIPARNFGKTSLDIRTKGRPTYPHYKGVCIVRCGRVAIQRKLVYIANTFCENIAKRMGG